MPARRIRWFALALDESMIRRLGNALRDAEFKPGDIRGFRLGTVRKDHIVSEYIERVEVEEVAIDPFGREFPSSRIEFHRVSFRLQSGTMGLEVRDSPRSLRGFFEQLNAVSHSPILVDALTVDLSAWVRAINDATEGARVTLVDHVRVALSADITARVIVEAEKDVRRLGARFIGERAASFDRARLLWFSESREVKCELTRDGRASVSSADDEIVIPILRRSLAVALAGAGTIT